MERRQTLAVLSNLLVVAGENGISLTATDLEVELVAQAAVEGAEPGALTIPARKFFDVCRTLPEEAQLEVVFEQERVTVRSGRSRFHLATIPADDFPNLEGVLDAQRFSIAQNALQRLISKTQFSMAVQDVRYYLNGLLLEVSPNLVRAVATDGHRLAWCEHSMDTGVEELRQVIVPRKGVQELLRLLPETDDVVPVELGTNHIRITLPEIRFTSKLIDGRFPDYQRVVPKGGERLLIAEREPLRQALLRTSILSNEKYRGIRLSFEAELLRMQAHNPEQEEAEEELAVSFRGEPLDIGFNVNYLIEAIAAVDGEQIQMGLIDSNSSCIIQAPGSSDCRYVVMPMRL